MEQYNISAPVVGDERPHPLRKKRNQPEPQRHQWVDAWKAAKASSLKALVERTIECVHHYEEHTRARVRARRPSDEWHHLKRIDAIVCNLAHAVLLPPPTG